MTSIPRGSTRDQTTTGFEPKGRSTLSPRAIEEADVNQIQHFAPTARKSPPSSLSAPRVQVRLTEAGPSIEPYLDGAVNSEDFRAAFLSAFGTIDALVAEALFAQLLNGLHTDPAKPVDNATANLALALMHAIGPKDVVEAMLGCQMVVAHVAAMDASRLALHVEQTPAGRQAYGGLARKLMGLYAAQVDALNRHRGRGATQKIIVEKVLIAPGAQAVVGSVSNGRGDGGGR